MRVEASCGTRFRRLSAAFKKPAYAQASGFRMVPVSSEAHLENAMKTRAGKIIAGAAALAFAMPVATASAQELSEMAVKSFMDFAWSLTPQQFSKPDGTTVLIDKKKPDEVKVPVDVAREVIKAGRLSAHAQICDLRDEQKANHISLMKREEAKKKWTPQQLVYISQLHLTTVMLLTGKIRLVEKEGDKEVIVEEGKAPATTCTDEQRKKVVEMIVAYVKSGPQPKGAPPADEVTIPAATAAGGAAAAAAANKKAADGTTTGSTATAAPASAAAPAAGAAPAAKQPAAAPAAPAPEKK